MRDYAKELENRVAFINETVTSARATGIVYGNSGGKDSALVGILCKKAFPDSTLGVLLPCGSRRGYEEDTRDAVEVAERFDIAYTTVDLGDVKAAMMEGLKDVAALSPMAEANIAPRLRMTALYAVAQTRNALVAGTGNRSEGYMGYFTKWGDGAYDLNPMGDLTVTEIYEFLEFLDAPEAVRIKAPSAGLFEGQTDEAEMGITYGEIDRFLLQGESGPNIEKMRQYHKKSEHKRRMPAVYGGDNR